MLACDAGTLTQQGNHNNYYNYYDYYDYYNIIIIIRRQHDAGVRRGYAHAAGYASRARTHASHASLIYIRGPIELWPHI